MVDHTLHTKIKDLALIFLSVSLAHHVKKHLEQACWYIIFTDSHSFNEMFIFSGKSQCHNGTFTDALSTLLQAKNI